MIVSEPSATDRSQLGDPMKNRGLRRRLGALAVAGAVSLAGLMVGSGTAYADLPLCTRHDSVGPDGMVTAQVKV
jgi:hypothetical protein